MMFSSSRSQSYRSPGEQRAQAELECLRGSVDTLTRQAAFTAEGARRLRGALETVSPFGSDGVYDNAIHAVQDTADALNRYLFDPLDPLRTRDILNLPLRGYWISQECQAAASGEEGAALTACRSLFERNRAGVPALWPLRTNLRRAISRLGGERFLEGLGQNGGSPAEQREGAVPQHQGLVSLDRYQDLPVTNLNQLVFRGPRAGDLELRARVSFQVFDATRPPSREVIDDLERINSKLLIDQSRPEPQEGLGLLLTAETMRNWWFTSPTAHVFLLRLDGRAEGYLMVFPSRSGWPESGRIASRSIPSSSFSQPGWLEMAAITREAREVFKTHQTGGYSALLGLALESLLDLNVDAIYCMVREGPTANTAKAKHLREGFCELGLGMDFHGTPYSILAFDVEDAIDRRVLELSMAPGGRALFRELAAVTA